MQYCFVKQPCLTCGKHSMNNGYRSNNEKNQFLHFISLGIHFYIKSITNHVLINFSFILAFKWSLTNGGTLEVLFMLKSGYVSKRIAERKICP